MLLTTFQHFSAMLAVLSRKYHKIWILLHCWDCGAEQDLTQSHSSSVVPVPVESISSPQHTKAWSRARDPSRSRRTQSHRKSWTFPSCGIAGKRSESPRLSCGGAPGPSAGAGGGWAGPVKRPQAPNSFLYGKTLEKPYNLIHLIYVIILLQKTQA